MVHHRLFWLLAVVSVVGLARPAVPAVAAPAAPTAPAAKSPEEAGSAAPAKVRPVWTDHETVPGNPHDEEAWKTFAGALATFHGGGAREQLLLAVKDLRNTYLGSRYEPQWEDLIELLDREAATPAPAFLAKDAKDRTPDETIAFWIYQLRDLGAPQITFPGEPMLFAMLDQAPTACDRLVGIGPAALPQLIDALSDRTPTRTLAFQRPYSRAYFLLRRQDVALKCIEGIVGCRFYDEGATWMHFHMDTDERRASVMENMQAWWKVSRGKPQAQMIRNQLALLPKNITLNTPLQQGYDEAHMLEILAMLEGPESVLPRMRELLEAERDNLNGPAIEVMGRIDRRTVIAEALKRFWANQSRGGDYYTLLNYGDKKVYEEIARRFEQTGKLDPGSWNMPDQLRSAGRNGLQWAIPIAVHALRETKMTGGRTTGDGKSSVSFSTADVAVEVLRQLTGEDFGYQSDAAEEVRLAAISKAVEWWKKTGQAKFKEAIAADHPPVTDTADLLVSNAEIQRRVAVIGGNDAGARAKLLAQLGTVYSWQVEQALVAALARSSDATEKTAILAVLERRPALWMFPALIAVFQGDKDMTVRLGAGRIIQKVVGDKTPPFWWQRLETREAALSAARQLLGDAGQPAEIRQQAAAILRAWGTHHGVALAESAKL
jgi:hypothetical protein